MKLLTPTDTVQQKSAQLAVTQKRSISLDLEIERKRQEIEKLTSEFQFISERQANALEKELTSYHRELEGLRADVESLELRKKLALVPLDEKWKDLQKGIDFLKAEQQKFEEFREDFEEKAELLGDKLTQVAEREQKAAYLSKKQVLAQEGIDTQKEQIKIQSQQFNDLVAKSIVEFDLSSKTLNAREAEVTLREKNVLAKALELNKIEQGFVDRERQIQSKYQSLLKAQEYVKRQEG